MQEGGERTLKTDWLENALARKRRGKEEENHPSEKEKMRWNHNNSEEEGPNRGGVLLARSVAQSSEKDKHEQSSQGRRRTREDFRTYSRASISRVDMTRCCHSRRCAHPQCSSVFRRPLLLPPPPTPPFSSRRLKDLILTSGAKHDAKKRSTWARGRRSRRKKEHEKTNGEHSCTDNEPRTRRDAVFVLVRRLAPSIRSLFTDLSSSSSSRSKTHLRIKTRSFEFRHWDRSSFLHSKICRKKWWRRRSFLLLQFLSRNHHPKAWSSLTRKRARSTHHKEGKKRKKTEEAGSLVQLRACGKKKTQSASRWSRAIWEPEKLP